MTSHSDKAAPCRVARIAAGIFFWAIWANVCAAQSFDTSRLSQPQYDVVVDKDVRIPMRDGGVLLADVYRPVGAAAEGKRFPVIMSLSAYLKELQHLPHGWPFTHQERPEPDFWVPRGYILIFVDTRGTGKSPGKADIWSMQEARDYYDAIEWAADQPWSSGKVGLGGVSYYAITQWNVAALQPPSLTTIVPWEGWADLYRDGAFHGGVFDMGFFGYWWTDVMGKQLLESTRADNPGAFEEHLIRNLMRHHVDSPWWDHVKARGQPERTAVPFLSAGNWDGWNRHLRGNLEMYQHAESRQKKLSVHTGGHTYYFYTDEGRLEMLRWYDHWLKGIDTGVMDEPPVKICVRESLTACHWRFEDDWPLARADYRRLYLTAGAADIAPKAEHDLRLSDTPPETADVVTYDANPAAWRRLRDGKPSVVFSTAPMESDIEVTGPIKLKAWVSSETEDMDIFAFLKKVYPDGRVETVTRGVLKVSHRALDPEQTTPLRPWHSHTREDKLTPGEVVPVEVEIWPTSMVWQAGTRLRLDIQVSDTRHYFSAYNIGTNSLYLGGDRASYLQIPVVPAKAEPAQELGTIELGAGDH